jgi:tetratricopeptide (TPR) repeat protein
MNSRPALSQRSLCLGVFMLVCVGANGYAEDEAFKRGLEARQSGLWEQAVRHMQQAVAADSREVERRVGGGIFGRGTLYLPYFFLGEALFNRNDCAGAIDAWSTSQRQGIVLQQDDYRRVIERGLAQCSRRGFVLPHEYAALVDATYQALNDASAVSVRVVALQQESRDLWQLHRDWADRYSRGSKEHASSAEQLKSAMTTRRKAEFEVATAAAERATEIFSSIEKEIRTAVEIVRPIQKQAREVEQLIVTTENADQKLDVLGTASLPTVEDARRRARSLIHDARSQLMTGTQAQDAVTIGAARKVVEQALALLDRALEDARAPVREAARRQLQGEVASGVELFSALEQSLARLEKLLSERPEQARGTAGTEGSSLRTRIAGARRRFDQARATDDFAGVQQAIHAGSAARHQLDALLMNFPSLSLGERGVSTALENGARLFLEGKYESALAALDTAALESTGPLVFHAHLMRAASLYKLYVRSGGKDGSLLKGAVAAAGECRRINTAFSPDPRVFDRRFITFFRTGAPNEHAPSRAGSGR